MDKSTTSKKVSIPYRTAKNFTTSRSSYCESILFQFLIGQLKTINGIEIHATNCMFQFLIGQLKTVAILDIALGCIKVSIPYRTAKNVDSLL